MNLQDLRALQDVHGYPCLTITLPTHRTHPDNRQDPIRVKQLVKQATDRLNREFSRRESGALLARLDELVGHIDYEHARDGLVLAVNADMACEYMVPFALAERVVVDETFFTRDLVRASTRTYRYWVLSLSEKSTRLFEGTREDLDEITTGGFPMVHTGPGGEAPLPRGDGESISRHRGVNISRHRDERHRQFFRAVDQALRPFVAADPLPVALVGVDRYLAFFQEVSSRLDIIASVRGNYDQLTAHDLGRVVWPAVADAFATRRREVLDRLEQAFSERRAAFTLDEVWHLASLGQGETLVVEDGYHQPARVAENGRLDLDVRDPTAPGVLDDAVDELIETVLAKGGRVVFVEDGALSARGRIALILRY
jgi:hypothetical protein